MLIFDTIDYDTFKLQKFVGGRFEVDNSHHTYSSFEKAKTVVVNGIENQIAELQKELDQTKAIMTPNDLDLTRNPFDG